MGTPLDQRKWADPGKPIPDPLRQTLDRGVIELAWRTYNAAALTGLLSRGEQSETGSNMATICGHAAWIADMMIDYERMTFPGGLLDKNPGEPDVDK